MGLFDVAFFVSAITIAAPILLAALGELVSERAGIMNVGLEGVLLAGAFAGYVSMTVVDNLLVGFVGGILGGLAFGALMGVLAIEAKVDQIVCGIALTLLGSGLTAFLNDRFFSHPSTFEPLPRLAIPGLSKLPVVGDVLFRQDLFIYAVAVVVVLLAVAIGRTTWGINLKAVGETPIAADAAGVSVRGVRWAAVLFSGACAGAAGAYISVGDVGVFREGMTGGRGYLALAAILFGGWRLSGLGVGVAIFAFTDATQLRLQSVGAIPSEVWVAVALVVAVAVAVGRIRLSGGYWRLDRRRLGTLDVAGGIVVVAMVVLVAIRPHLTLPVSIWLAMPYLLALAALAVGDNQRHRAPSALAIPYVRSEA
jgi:ABC-type uncharacterized transport system permease subunit